MSITVGPTGLPDITADEIAQFARTVLSGEDVDSEAEITIDFVSDDEIADLNERFMGKSGPTDVLSFPLEDATPGNPPKRQLGGPPVQLGDIFIATNVVAAHATEYEVTLRNEMYLMTCHGILHLLGWDHQTDEEAAAMEAREADYLATVGEKRR